MMLQAMALSQYSLPSNGFKSLLSTVETVDGVEVSASDKEITINNTTGENYLLVDSTLLPPTLRYSVLIANAGKGKKARWGVAVDVTPDGDMIAVEMESDNSSRYDDVAGELSTAISLVTYLDGQRNVVESVKLDKGIDMKGGYNVLTVDVSGHNVRVLVGRKKPEVVMEREVERNAVNSRVALLAGPGTCVKVSRTLLNYEPDNRLIKHSGWDESSLARYLASSEDPMEGMWQYLDRDMEEKIARMGGRYVLATVRNDDGNYDIIYVSGAQVNDKQWRPYLLKGTLKPTIFTGNYDAMWIDTNFNPISDEVQATIDNGVILSIKLPLLKAQLRFSKVLE